MTLIYLGIAWLAGIFLSSLLNLPALFLALVGLVPLVNLVLWRENPRVRLASLCALALLLGEPFRIGRLGAVNHQESDQKLFAPRPHR